MRLPHLLKIHGSTLWISAERCLFWEEAQALVVSDLHFGKTGHFRKSGIAVPQHVFKEDIQRLVAQLQHFQPRQLLVVGDLFHSSVNRELDLFTKWRANFPDLAITLVKGNHDILKPAWYADAGIDVHREALVMNGFCFRHDGFSDCAGTDGEQYVISGHLHPGIRVSGAAKQSLCLPCFYFGKRFAILPAFSRFTGTAIIDPKAGDRVFALVNHDIVEI